MSISPHFGFDSNLNKLKHEILERESELDTAKRNAAEAQKNLLDVTKNFTKLKETLLKVPKNEQSSAVYELLQSFRNDLTNQITQATLKSSQAIKKTAIASEALKTSQQFMKKYEIQQTESHKSKARMKAQYPDPEEYEKQMFQKVLNAAGKGTTMIENAEQEKFQLYQNEKDYENFAKTINKFNNNESFRKDPMLREADSNLQKLRDTIDKKAEDYLEIKEKAWKFYVAALKLKEFLSPEYRKLILQDLQSLMPTAKKPSQVQMSPPKQIMSPHRRVVVAPERSFVSPPLPVVQKSQVSQVQFLPKTPPRRIETPPQRVKTPARTYNPSPVTSSQASISPFEVEVSPISRKSPAKSNTPIKSHSPRRLFDVPKPSGFNLMDMNSIDDLLNFNEAYEMPIMSAQMIPNKQQCREFIENLYNEVKNKHLNSVLCGEVLSTPAEERENLIMNQMFNVLESYIQEIQEENEMMTNFE